MRHVILRRLPGVAVVLGALMLGLALLPSAARAAGPPPSPVTLVPLPVAFANQIGIDAHEPTQRLLTSLNYPAGTPRNLALIGSTGASTPFSSLSGVTDEVNPATVRASGCQGGFTAGEAFTGANATGEIARFSPAGVLTSTISVGTAVGTGRVRSLFQDIHCVAGGDLIAATTTGRVYRVTSAGTASLLGSVGVDLEGLITIPNDPRYGPWAGKVLAGAPSQGRIYVFSPTGGGVTFTVLPNPSGGSVNVNVEDFEIVPANQNFFAVEWGAGRIVGAPASAFLGQVGDILIVQSVPAGRIFNVRWDDVTSQFEVVSIASGNWFEQATFSRAGVGPISPIAPAFSQPGSNPGLGTCICLPPYMLRDGGSQDWWIRASGTELLQITGKGIGVNPSEGGTLTFRLYDATGTLLQTQSVTQPASGEVSAPFTPLAVPAGTLVRVNVIATTPSGALARHYRLEAVGAAAMGTDSPTPSQAEHDRARWIVNVNAHENVAVRVLAGDEAGATGGTVKVYDPHGVLRDTKGIGQIAGASLVAAADAGQWTVEVDLDGHYTVEKIDGADRGIYVDWRTWGKGEVSLSLYRADAPMEVPVTVEVIDTLSGQTVVHQPGVLAVGSATLPAGEYLLRLIEDNVTLPFVVTCNGETVLVIDLPNQPPTTTPQVVYGIEDTPVSGIDLLLGVFDPDSTAFTVTSVSGGAFGTVVTDGARMATYTPMPDFSGTDAFTYTIMDSHGGTATGTVTVHIAPVNDDPAAAADTATTDAATPVTVDVLANDWDVDGDTLTVVSVTQGANGTVAVNGDGTVTYTPDAGFSGVDTFTYTVGDGAGGEATATVTVTVNAGNRAPEVGDDTATTDAATPVTVDVLANDWDVDGDTLTVVSVTQGANGTVAVNGDGTVTYTPDAGFSGVDTFTYTVGDGAGGEATATVTVTVNAVQVDPSRMTGGGNLAIGQGRNTSRWTWGFEIRCDGSQGNFQYQDHTGGNFHLTGLTSVLCSDDPGVSSGNPRAPFNTMQFSGTGRWNGVAGYLVDAVIVDAGEPGRNDRIVVTVRTAGGAVVSTVSGTLSGGNHQAHR